MSRYGYVLLLCSFVWGCEKDQATPGTTPQAKSKRTALPAVRQPLKRVAKRVLRPAPPRKPAKPSMDTYLRKPPQGFVDLKTYIPGIKLHIGYHTKDNFTGAPLPGYGAPGAWLRKRAADALVKVQKLLRAKGMGLLVYDAYRPVRGTLGMVAWARREGKLDLFKNGYIARRSGHNRGHTIDLTIIYRKTGKPLDMGTPWDTLDPRSNTRNAKGKALKNRLLLKRIMRKHGFRPYSKEWWHFGFRMKGTRPRDVPYSCFEPPEGKWKPKRGWDKAGYQMPLSWAPQPCR